MLLKMTLSGGFLIVFIIFLRLLFINRLPKRIFVLLWFVALFRLLLPFELPFSYGIASPVMQLADSYSDSGMTNKSSIIDLPSVMEPAPAESLTAAAPNTATEVNWPAAIGLMGTLLLFTFFIVSYLREYRRLQTALPISKEEEKHLRTLTCIPRRIRLLVSDRITSPLSFGIVSPKIILSKIYTPTDPELKYVLTHELVHIRRADNFWKIFMILAVCIHWFNPLVWIMYFLFNRDLELSCDEKVISILGEHEKRDYAMTLVCLAEKQIPCSLFSNGFAKNTIQERIVAIMKYKKTTFISISCAILLIGIAITAFAHGSEPTVPAQIDGSLNEQAVVGNEIRIVPEDYKKHLPEYAPFGLYHDSAAEHFLYEGEVVGYFKDTVADSKSESTFIRRDTTGVVGIQVIRDSNNHIAALEKTGIPEGFMELTEEELNAFVYIQNSGKGELIGSVSQSPAKGVTLIGICRKMDISTEFNEDTEASLSTSPIE